MSDIANTLAERQSKYGPFLGQACISQKLKNIWRVSPGYRNLQQAPLHVQSVVNEGVEMILHKLARAFNGDPTYDDNYRDIAGYAERILEVLTQQSSPSSKNTQAEDLSGINIFAGISLKGELECL